MRPGEWLHHLVTHMANGTRQFLKGEKPSPSALAYTATIGGLAMGISIALEDIEVARRLMQDMEVAYGDDDGERVAEEFERIRREEAHNLVENFWQNHEREG